jgi:hypothetical protein
MAGWRVEYTVMVERMDWSVVDDTTACVVVDVEEFDDTTACVIVDAEEVDGTLARIVVDVEEVDDNMAYAVDVIEGFRVTVTTGVKVVVVGEGDLSLFLVAITWWVLVGDGESSPSRLATSPDMSTRNASATNCPRRVPRLIALKSASRSLLRASLTHTSYYHALRCIWRACICDAPIPQCQGGK